LLISNLNARLSSEKEKMMKEEKELFTLVAKDME